MFFTANPATERRTVWIVTTLRREDIVPDTVAVSRSMAPERRAASGKAFFHSFIGRSAARSDR